MRVSEVLDHQQLFYRQRQSIGKIVIFRKHTPSGARRQFIALGQSINVWAKVLAPPVPMKGNDRGVRTWFDPAGTLR
jgi:hypothetical protein